MNLDSHTVNWGSLNGGIDVNNAGNTFTISEAIGGTGSLTKAGLGTLVLSGSNSYSGGTTLTGGELSIGTDSNIGGAGSTINFNGGTLQVTGTAITNLDSHIVNWGSFNGGIDVNNAGNTFTVSEAIGGTGGLIKVGAGTLVLADNNTYTGTTLVNAGTLQLGEGSAIPSGGNVTVASGASFDIQGFSNSQDSPMGTLTLLGGTFRVPTGSGDYYLNGLAMSGGTVDFTGTSKFWLHLTGTNPSISTSASTTTAVWTGAGRSRIENDSSSPLTIDVAAGTTPSGIDLDAGIEISDGGTSPDFIKAGAGGVAADQYQ